MDSNQQQKAAEEFAKKWLAKKGYEKGEAQVFWIDLLTNVFGVKNAVDLIKFEEQVELKNTSFIDARIPSTKVLIEQKGSHVKLDKEEKQSSGERLTPYEQAKRYDNELPTDEKSRWIVTCNFREFRIYNLNQPRPQDNPTIIPLEKLGKEYVYLQFLIDPKNENIHKERELSFEAGKIVGKLYDSLKKAYGKDDPKTLKALNVLCVRLVFCLYAEDSGLFPQHLQFYQYLNQRKDSIREALLDLFRILNTPENERSDYEKQDLRNFPYVNGNLFEKTYDIPPFSEDTTTTLLEEASSEFDWSEIDPTIFGGVFESTLNPETRRKGGMHYTSIENIHKVIDPLFLDDLRTEFEEIRGKYKSETSRNKALTALQNRISSLKFLDPACGSGNFLTETYLSLRRLENDILRIVTGGQIAMGEIANPIQVSINQFFGIEINDFAVSVARTALWIAEAQMFGETSKIVQKKLDFLPLKSNSNIVEENALSIDWNKVVPAKELNYIMGNPPFVGRRYRNKQQQEEIASMFTYKDIDYVACWFYKASKYIDGTNINCAFVATNSISQGEQVPALWEALTSLDIDINFAYQTFIWDNESKEKAHVHVVIIGFSKKAYKRDKKLLFTDGKEPQVCQEINGYLIPGPQVLLSNRSSPLWDVPKMANGNVPLDGDALKIEAEDLPQFKEVPKKFIKNLIGGRELLYNQKRYVLWLVDASPSDIKKYPKIKERVELCRKNRLAMKDKGTQKLADTPQTFRDTRNPENFIALPMVSGERRAYLPCTYLNQDYIPTNQVQTIANAEEFHFGVLSSSVHMAWMRTVTGRLKSDYRYSKDIVYNNFPWPNPTEKQKEKIRETARRILETREKYSTSSLADLYDPVSMPPDLLKAHRENDKAVMAAYGFPVSLSEREIVGRLFKLYEQKVGFLKLEEEKTKSEKEKAKKEAKTQRKKKASN